MDISMRRSRTLELLRAGKTVFSVKLGCTDPKYAEIAAMMGFPCIWVDAEHTANDYYVIKHQIMAAKIYDTDILVDASGIMVPHVMSAEDAKRVVHMTRFHPIGRRPVDGGNADARYGNIPQAEYNRIANDQRFIILQIEDPEAMEQIDEIAAVPGYDMLFFGPGDFSHSIGHSGEMNHPDVVNGFVKVAEAARKHGKFAGTVGSMSNARERVEMGYQFMNIASDGSALRSCFREVMKFSDSFPANRL